MRRGGGAAGAPELPPIYCPIEPAVHPRTRQVEQRAIAWIDRLGLCSGGRERARLIATRSAEFYARFAPRAPEDRLLAAATWVYWAFAFDDAHCDQGALSDRPAEFVSLAARLQRELELPRPGPGDPEAAALADIGRRLRDFGTSTQYRRFLDAHRAWLFGVTWQIGNRARGHRPGLDEYLAMRLHSAGGEPVFAMLEIANGPEVPAREMDAPAVRALTEMAILVAGLDNDRQSFRKERLFDEDDQNVFTVLAHEAGCPVEQVVHRAIEIRDRVLTRFLHLRQQVLRDASAELRGYLAGLAHGIRGNAEWGQRVPRYVSPGAPAVRGEAAVPVLAWADRPADSRPEPLPIPSIAWWWDPLA